MVSFLANNRQWTIAVIVGLLMLLLLLCAVLLVLPALTTAQCEPQLTVQDVLTQDAGGTEQTTFAPGETIRFVAEVNNAYGGWMLGSNGTELAITTSFYSAANPVDIPPGVSTWTWEAAAPSTAGDYTVEVRVYDHFCGISGGLGTSFIVGEPEETPPPEAEPTIALEPTEGAPGTEVTVHGSSWIAGDTIFIHFAIAGNEVAQATVADDGSFEVTFTVPDDAEKGDQLVIAGNNEASWQTDAIFHVTESTEEPTCPEPTVTLSASSGKPGDTITVQGKGWLPGGTVAIALVDGPVQLDVGSVQVPDSGAWETSFTVPDEPYDYWLAFSENHEECELYVEELFTIEAPSDTEPPTVSWVKPVGNRGVYPTTNGTVELEVSATDNTGIQSVEFYRWDAVNLQVVGITTDSAPPYQASIEINTLNMKWNQINAVVADTAGNKYEDGIFIYRLAPTITLDTPESSRGTEVTATGSGWLPGDTVNINFADPADKVAQATVDAEGNFVTKFTVPANAAIGEQKVIAITPDGLWLTDAVFQVTEPGRLRVIKALSMANTDLLVGETVNVSFTVKNVGGSTLHLEELAAGARRGRDWNGEEADFTPDKNISLPPGGEHVYKQSGSFDTAGEYFAEPVKKINGKWGGIENANRVSFKVQVYATIKPPPSLSKVIDSARYRADINNDSGAELRLTEEGMRQLRNGTKNEQIRLATRMAEWLMSQPRWPEAADRTRQSVANEIHCHAHPIINRMDVNLHYHQAGLREELTCGLPPINDPL